MSTITERVKTFEDACEVLGINAAIPDFSAMAERFQKPLFAHYQLCIIAEALNEGWKPDWKNNYERKWNPVFDMNARSSSSGRFSFYRSADWHSGSNVGSRLCFRTEELSDYAAKQFEPLYREYFVIEN